MKYLRHLIPATSALIGSLGFAQNNLHCDCTNVVASCSANVTIDDQSIEVRSSTDTCSRIDYFVDGQPFVALVVDGSENRPYTHSGSTPDVLVQSCQVCSEAKPADSSLRVENTEVAEPIAVEKLEPLIRVTPRYPERARLNRVQGKVVVEFAVNADGAVERPRVLSASPRRTFEQAALAAIKRWRYPVREPNAQAVTLREEIEFTLAGANSPRSTANGHQVSTRPRPANRPRNECIRESVSYDYGDQVEVGLINACQAPVVVYACGIGTGNNFGLWVCHTPEVNRTALVRRGIDAMNSAIHGGHDLRYVEDQFLMRAPNSQYWWIACEPSDTRCRAAGLEWTSDIQRTPSTVDPQKTARINLARSR